MKFCKEFAIVSFLKVFNLNGEASSFLGSTAQLRAWLPPQNPAEFLEGFSTIFFFTV
jgi:hypothetical protein